MKRYAWILMFCLKGMLFANEADIEELKVDLKHYSLEKILSDAGDCWKGGDTERALKIYNALRKEEDLPDFLIQAINVQRGTLLFEVGKEKSGIEDFLNLLDLDEEDVPDYKQKIRALIPLIKDEVKETAGSSSSLDGNLDLIVENYAQPLIDEAKSNRYSYSRFAFWFLSRDFDVSEMNEFYESAYTEIHNIYGNLIKKARKRLSKSTCGGDMSQVSEDAATVLLDIYFTRKAFRKAVELTIELNEDDQNYIAFSNEFDRFYQTFESNIQVAKTSSDLKVEKKPKAAPKKSKAKRRGRKRGRARKAHRVRRPRGRRSRRR